MRNKLVLITLSVLISAGCYAQNQFPRDGVFKVKGEEFKVSHGGPNKEWISVYNVKGKRAKGERLISANPYVPILPQENIHFDKVTANAIIKRVLKPKIEVLRQKEDFVSVTLTFDLLGKITDISYGLDKNTPISLEDIAKIDARLRSSITATFTGNFKDYNLFIYNFAMYYVQSEFPREGVFKVKNEEFRVSYEGPNKEWVSVYNVNDRYGKGGMPMSDDPYVPPYSQRNIYFDKATAKAIIKGVLKPKIKELRQDEDFINVTLTFERSGKIFDISYRMNKNTQISVKDIAEIDAQLRSRITATFTGNFKDYNFHIYNLTLNF